MKNKVEPRLEYIARLEAMIPKFEDLIARAIKYRDGGKIAPAALTERIDLLQRQLAVLYGLFAYESAIQEYEVELLRQARRMGLLPSRWGLPE